MKYSAWALVKVKLREKEQPPYKFKLLITVQYLLTDRKKTLLHANRNVYNYKLQEIQAKFL